MNTLSLRRLCRNALLLLLCVTLNGHAFAQSGESEQSEPQQQELVFDDAVQAANALIINQQFAGAEEFIIAQMQREDVSDQDRAVLYYLLALALVGQDKNSEAEAILRQILIGTPDATHVRLSLARVLFNQGKDDAAERQLDLVLADKTMPPHVLQQAHIYLKQIETRNGWSFNGSFGVKRDDNAASAASAADRRNSRWGRTCFAPGVCFYAAVTPSETTYYGNWSVSAQHRRQIGKRAQWQSRFSLNGNIAPGNWDDSLALQISAGPRLFFPRGLLDLSVTGNQQFSPNRTSRSFGMLASYQHALPGGKRPFITAQYQNQNHLLDDRLDAHLGYIQTGMHMGLDAVTSASGSYTFTRNVAELSSNSYKRWAANINAQRDFPYGITFGLGASYTRGWHDAGVGILPDERYTEKNYSAFILKRDLDIFCGFVPLDAYVPGGGKLCNFAPKLTFSRVDRQSNLVFDGRHYSKDVIGLEFTGDF